MARIALVHELGDAAGLLRVDDTPQSLDGLREHRSSWCAGGHGVHETLESGCACEADATEEDLLCDDGPVPAYEGRGREGAVVFGGGAAGLNGFENGDYDLSGHVWDLWLGFWAVIGVCGRLM